MSLETLSDTSTNVSSAIPVVSKYYLYLSFEYIVCFTAYISWLVSVAAPQKAGLYGASSACADALSHQPNVRE